MAKICAHAYTVGTVEFVTTAKRYMGDGVILRNSGHGWKLIRHEKPGFGRVFVARVAVLFARIAGTKTLTSETLTLIRALGYSITVEAPRVSLAECAA